MLSVRETAFDCLLAITREHIATPDDRHFAILCELAEISETLREFMRPKHIPPIYEPTNSKAAAAAP